MLPALQSHSHCRRALRAAHLTLSGCPWEKAAAGLLGPAIGVNKP